MAPSAGFCEACARAGVTTLAEYVYQPEEASLVGPLMGDPDYWPPNVVGRRLLCREHYEQVPPDGQLDYVPAESRLAF